MGSIRSYLNKILQRLRASTPQEASSSIGVEDRKADEDVQKIDEENTIPPSSLASEGSHDGESELLNNAAWMKLARACVNLIDDLERQSASMEPQRQELALYVCDQLGEILERSGVKIIAGDSTFDEDLHRPVPAISRVPPGTVIVETLSPGFAVGPRVLRRARVRLLEEV